VHLKTLSLVGFKSFADRTRIECEPGVTVVVGPNGSGKSNIVDGIAWVLGTQATTSLRTQKMEDVIFAGTATRPALGRAEVSLTLDNASGDLELDLSEVTITRRLFRDGTSEYEINGTPCRLLDIQELLGDSGVGRHQHVLIGQGRVDGVLNAGPEEHRAIIEEAAGVIKHRNRRDRSIRRLEATDLDITRLNDLLAEQQRLMRPLKRQAKAAEQYEAVKQQWRALRLWLGGEQLRTVRDRLAEIRSAKVATERDLAEAVAAREEITASLGRLQAEAGETGSALERDSTAIARLETAAERLQRIALVARERRLGLEHRMTGVSERRSDLEAERRQLEESITVARSEEGAATEQAERLTITLQALDDEERSLADTDRLPAAGVAASLQGDLASLEAAAVRDDRESSELTRRRGAVAAVIEEEVAEVERLTTARAEVEAERDAHRAEHERIERLSQQDGSAAEEARQAAADAERSLAAAEARLEALESADAGLSDEDSVAAAREHEAVVGTVLGRLDAPADLDVAVKAALGAWASGFAATGAPHRSVARALMERDLGGVAVVHGLADRSVPARSSGSALIDRLGANADPMLAATLLGDVVLAGSWEEAVAAVEEEPELRAVTRRGDLVTAAGVVVATPDGRGPAIIAAGRRAVEAARTELARAMSHRSSAERAEQGSQDSLAQAAAAHDAATRRVAAIDETLRLLERSRAERQAELDRLEARGRALAEAAATRSERMSALRSRLADAEGGDIDAGALEAMGRRREELARRRDEMQHRHQEAVERAAAAAERRGLMEQRLAELSTLFDGDDEVIDDVALGRLTEAETQATRARAAVRQHLATLRQRRGDLRERAGDAGSKLEAARQHRDELGDTIAAARERVSAFAVEDAELTVREESIAEGLRRDVDADGDTALVAPRPELDDDVDAEELLATLEAKVKRLGPVNPLAAAEYRELEERASFLSGQLEDLAESRSELTKVIEALDEEIGRLFLEAFESIAGFFTENFELLFPGGTGKISLTEADDPLNTGVEIFAQPMGKKVDRLQLLSGGERSLAALAFLFAVFRARPSPFYVLDEVEAALDDANLRRFLRLVATLRDTSQLVIVTHQQQTMEAADVLYGVTMEPGESSRVLAKRMTELVT